MSRVPFAVLFACAAVGLAPAAEPAAPKTLMLSSGKVLLDGRPVAKVGREHRPNPRLERVD